MNLDNINKIYFIGIGGIGMSALARYFVSKRILVAGYDRTRTEITDALEKEGIPITFTDAVNQIPAEFISNPDDCLIVYTPAIPANHKQYNYFIDNKYTLVKRAKMLGVISQNQKTIAVAGTHGKTTVSTLVAHLLSCSSLKCNAFLGGVSKNFHSNIVLAPSEYMVAEADEYDRSFLNLHPYCGVITAIDSDHLDIYGSHDAIKKSFNDFVHQYSTGGFIVTKAGLELNIPDGLKQFSYDVQDPEADFYATDIETQGGESVFTLQTPKKVFKKLVLGVPGLVNIENAIAASSIVLQLGISEHELRLGLESFSGIRRRFDYQVNKEVIYIDDYAHHPAELDAFLGSVKNIYPTEKITGIFQPHLFSRTKDFAQDFAKSLSVLDELLLLPIYPAREEPIPGVTSDIILRDVQTPRKRIINKDEVIEYLKKEQHKVILTMGAGDIDTLRAPLVKMLEEKYSNEKV